MGGRGASSATSSGTQAARTPEQVLNGFVAQYFNEDGYFIASRERREALMNNGLNDRPLQFFIDDNELYGKPTILTEEEVNEYAKENGTPIIYRGQIGTSSLSGYDMHMNLLYDDRYYVGEGIHGDGMYFGDIRVAEMYGRGDCGAIIKATLKKDAKVISEIELGKQTREWVKTLNQKEFYYSHDDAVHSMYALAHGYDAIRCTNGYYVLLNRNALIASSNVREYDKNANVLSMPTGAKAITITANGRPTTYYEQNGMLMRSDAVGTTHGTPAGVNMSLPQLFRSARSKGQEIKVHTPKAVEEANKAYAERRKHNAREIANAETSGTKQSKRISKTAGRIRATRSR